MPRSRLFSAESPTEGHVRATVTLRRYSYQSRRRWILSGTWIFAGRNAKQRRRPQVESLDWMGLG